MKVQPYHTVTPEKDDPGHRDVYHDLSGCPDGLRTKISNRRPGTAGRPGLDPGTLGLKEGCIWSDWSGGVGIIRESKKTCPVVSDSSGGVGFVRWCGIGLWDGMWDL